ncbi:MAG TPA: outer membrane protein assembly factor BamD [Ferruginibacter sp.]|jgi:outer membrane protein assembly factor BamD|nr:outer membrane protein assembly factor BamD [Chitinophagales bacterium]HMW26286.1 outer membrane protein assembly factor BamD [Ferruginibacter sp.]HMX79570.1 outer membrane protein assembly factor BamD [Ferruginibacter sp.]HNA02051.1 outer membrane protein assembly factor BamD [Ferruginibacter sp.]HNA16312.1 outer membrane protein assembly factor BamD [Ferruginibacter sp.]
MKRIKTVSAGILLVLLVTACNKYNKISKSKDYEYKLSMADKFYEQKKYKIAQQLYEELFTVFKGTTKFEELYYKDAYCFYYMKQYADAESLFKGFLEVFPNSSKAEEVDYMRSYCFYKQSPKLELEQVNTTRAMGMMQTFINTHPGSPRNKEASDIIDKCREKLEQKEYRAAELYYAMGQYRAAAIAFATLLNNYPESKKGEEYKLRTVKSYYKFAKLSIADKQLERYEKVVDEYEDFVDRYPESKLLKEAESYSNLSKNHIKDIKNEQTQTSAKR